MSNNLVRGAFMNNFGTAAAKKSNKSMYNTYQRCRSADVIPGGMNMRTYAGKLYAVDPKLEKDPIRLTIKDMVDVLKSKPAVKDVTRVASKLGFDFTGSVDQTKAMICDALEAHNITEPVFLRSTGAGPAKNRMNNNIGGMENNARGGMGSGNNARGGGMGSGVEPESGGGGGLGNGNRNQRGSGMPPPRPMSFKPHITLNSNNKNKKKSNGNRMAPEENLGNLRPGAGIRGDPKEAILRSIKNELSNVRKQVGVE